MIFVLLTYGGWNEAAYLAGEVREPRRNMMRILVGGIVAVTALYLLVNLGYLAALGQGGVARRRRRCGADVMRLVAGEAGAVLLVAHRLRLGAHHHQRGDLHRRAHQLRLGRDYPLFRKLGDWRETGSTPANALLLQGAITLVLIAAGALTPDGFDAMVAYTSPVFWTFFLLTGVTLVSSSGCKNPAESGCQGAALSGDPADFLRHVRLHAVVERRLHLQSGLRAEVRQPVLAGLLVMAAGIPLYWLARRK